MSPFKNLFRASSSSSSAHHYSGTDHAEAWFKADLICCKDCPKNVDKYLRKKKAAGELTNYYTNMDDVIFAEGYLDVNDMAWELSKKVCNPVTVVNPNETQLEEEMADETSLRHQRPLQDETIRRKYGSSVSVTSLEVDESSIHHQRPLQDETHRRRYGSSSSVSNVIESAQEQDIYYEDFGGYTSYNNGGTNYNYAGQSYSQWPLGGGNDFGNYSNYEYGGSGSTSHGGGHDYNNNYIDTGNYTNYEYRGSSTSQGGGHDYNNNYNGGDRQADCSIM